MAVAILAVGDSYMPTASMTTALDDLGAGVAVRYRTVDPNDRPAVPGIREYQGSPAAVSGWLTDERVLVVHAAPVTRQLLEAHPDVRLVACLRGGAVNVDLQAARELGVTVTNTPGKNAQSVADLTLVYIHMLLRGVGPAARWLQDRAEGGEQHLDSTFVGGEWIAREPRGLTLGLVGFGAIGRLVAAQASTYGMRVLAYDPHVAGRVESAESVSLDELAGRSDLVSVHATSTDENRHLVGTAFLAGLRPGGFVINTARQGLVDEDALVDALRTGHLAGAALDVCEPDGRWPTLSRMPNVILTPHLGGATVQTQQRGLEMASADIRRFLAGEPVDHRVA